MEEENFVAIFTRHLAKFLENKQFDLNDIWYMLEQFKPVCENIKTREDLLNFLQIYIADYPALRILEEKLLNKNYIFKEYL